MIRASVKCTFGFLADGEFLGGKCRMAEFTKTKNKIENRLLLFAIISCFCFFFKSGGSQMVGDAEYCRHLRRLSEHEHCRMTNRVGTPVFWRRLRTMVRG